MTIESVHEILQQIVDMLQQTAGEAKQNYNLSEEGSMDKICYKLINNAACKAALAILNEEEKFASEMMIACLKVIHDKANEEES